MVDSLGATLENAMFRPNDQLQPVPWLLHSEPSVSAAELSCCKGADACVMVPTRHAGMLPRHAADSVTGLYKRKGKTEILQPTGLRSEDKRHAPRGSCKLQNQHWN